MHMVDDSVDRSPIVAQDCMPIIEGPIKEGLMKVSFIQKGYLGLLLVELFADENAVFTEGCSGFTFKNEMLFNNLCNPAIVRMVLIKELDRQQQREGIVVV